MVLFHGLLLIDWTQRLLHFEFLIVPDATFRCVCVRRAIVATYIVGGFARN